MKKVSLALALFSTALFTPMSWSGDLQATTRDPVYKIDNELVLGRTENVYYNDIPQLKGVPFTGKIDTGADTTSMHAENIHVISQNPKYQHLKDDALMEAVVEDMDKRHGKWEDAMFKPYRVQVSFEVRHPYTGKVIKITDDIERIAMIRSRTNDKPILRPTINLPLTIAGHTVNTDVNLADRSGFSAPVLIGKTFLENNAWVFAGYDYLQGLPQAQVIGKHETVNVGGLPYKTSFSLKNNYSIANAKDIQVDKKARQVSFTLIGSNGQRKAMTLPLVKMLRVSGTARPLVYLPVKLNDTQTEHWLVYLRDRSHLDTQLRIGLNTTSRYFVIDSGRENLLRGGEKSYNNALKSHPLVVSPEEEIELDGVTLRAEPSFAVNTPLLRVSSFELVEGKKPQVEFYLPDGKGGEQKVVKEVIKNIVVGESTRPIVEGEFTFGGETRTLAFAVDVVEKKGQKPYFTLGQKMAKGGVLVNTRAENLLDVHPLFRAGHIEVAQVEGLSFPVKLDTGADISSINAQDIKQFDKDGKKMVTFTYENDLGMKKQFTREVVDVMRIRARDGEKANVRPVVKMRVSLGGIEKAIRVNLQDRSRFHYSMILGRNFLKYGAVVSSDKDYIVTDKPASEQ
ncbi:MULTISPECIES: putative ATP-dependent zinc protease [Vibrio]|uniref:Retropepsin-like aspartic endopeptidase domain-containing protein n=1 Tax=Vibrio proteolyticus NBRC 13287 TaxID=1219065 RepID=U2ZG59_VIBPR|nr:MULTISPECIES: RimK/LysX family protein [Vibrio]NAX22417.1 peptidase [Vibrio sp. V39_P1S14PM300]GAD66671.1 hypothetical protein VPR01S_04_02750 [Vibrio proteolyticus NBRC 13287]